jgi:hypothetical protein
LDFGIVWTPHVKGVHGANGVNGGSRVDIGSWVHTILTERLNHERHEVVLVEAPPLLLIGLGERVYSVGQGRHATVREPVGHSENRTPGFQVTPQERGGIRHGGIVPGEVRHMAQG